MSDLPNYGSDIDPMFSSEMHKLKHSKLQQFMYSCDISPNDRQYAYDEMKRIEHEYIFNPNKG